MVTFADAPWPVVIQAHLSPFSAPLPSSQPPFGYWSVIVSAISWPSTIVIPAFEPRPLKFAPHEPPASVMYGRFVYAMFPYGDEVELCHAQYCVPKPAALLCVAVAMTYCVVLFEPLAVLLKCCAALIVSPASCDCVGCAGAAEAASYQTDVDENDTPPPAAVPAPLQKVVPDATPWQ